MSFPQTQSDLEELAEPGPRNVPLDPLGMLLECAGYSAGHTFDERYEVAPGIFQRVTVSRFYWAVKVAVDFERDTGPLQARESKRAVLAKRGVRLIVIRDAFDTQTARNQLRPAQAVVSGKPLVVGVPRKQMRGRARTAR